MFKRILGNVPVTISVPLLLTVPLLVVSGVLLAVLLIQGRASTESFIAQTMEQIHRRVRQRLDAQFALPARITAVNVGLLDQGRLDPDDLRSWRPHLYELAHSFGALSSITWGDVTGRASWVARYAGEDRLVYAVKDRVSDDLMREYLLDDDGEPLPDLFNSYEYDLATRPWYREPIEREEDGWGNPFVWVGGDPSIPPTVGFSYGARVFGDDGALVGVIDAEFSLDDLSDFLVALNVSERGVVFVTDAGGRLLANSVGAPIADGTELIAASASSHPAIAAAAAATGEGAIEIDGERWWSRVSPIVHDSGFACTIVSLVPESEFTAAVDAARARSLAVIATAIVLTVALGIGIAFALLRPLLVLEAHARRVGEGDLEAEIALDQTPELRRLSTSINDMTAGLRERLELRRSLELAMEVQQNLLPSEVPELAGLDIAGHSVYCDETGGDYYDFLDVADLPGDSISVAVGDVMGHGIAAAMLMATARGILRSESRSHASIAHLLRHMNDLLARDTGGKRFMTMLLMQIDPATRTARWASAGHGPPVVFDPRIGESGDIMELDGGDMPLGLMEGVEYEDYEIADLAPGSVVLIATDGVNEAPGPGGDEDMFGWEKMHEVLRANHERSAQEISDALRAAVNAHMGDAAQNDDVTFVIVKVLGG